ncbi:MAG: DUF1257 domain-containing protein [Cyanobacteria bacterium REEB417]|nr:DUF1257 domain-containing protein [Cyanobacteria bacterium REEB417]
MSHLSILPTVLRDETLLASALEELQLPVVRGGCLRGFADEREPVVLQTQLAGGPWIGWRRQPDGSLALVGDLQRLGRAHSPQQLIGRITRCYATLLALRSAAQPWGDARVEASVQVSV